MRNSANYVGGNMKNAKFLIVLTVLLMSILIIAGCADEKLPNVDPGTDAADTSGTDTTAYSGTTADTEGEDTKGPVEVEFEPLKYGSKRLSLKRVSVHDPSIVYDSTSGTYYLFGSHRAWAKSRDLASWETISLSSLDNAATYNRVFKSNIEWSSHGSPNGKYDVSGNMWAPDVIYNEAMGKWCMYMSINGDNYYSSIALLTADRIDGRYEYVGTIVYSGFTSEKQLGETDFNSIVKRVKLSRYAPSGRWDATVGPNAIDPCVFYDKDGELWMSYGSWFGGIFMLKLDNNTGLRDTSYTYDTRANKSDEYFGYRISGGYGGTGEGSYIVWDPTTGYYYLYVSYCGLNATDNFSGYHIRLFRSEEVMGPYVDSAGNDAVLKSANLPQEQRGVKLFGNYALSGNKGNGNASDGYMSGGHNSALIDSDGQHYLVYHTRFNVGQEWHEVRIHQQFMNEDGWPVTAVYEHQGSVIEKDGYSVDEIVGEYEYIDHGVAATTTKIGMLKTKKVTLNADGTISGDVTGTWDQHKGADGNGYYVTMVIGSATYKGVFFKQYDETTKHAETMTFTLIGDNDHSIWGSKVG